MESLAVVVAALLLIAVLAGPLAILLSSKRLTNFLKSSERLDTPSASSQLSSGSLGASSASSATSELSSDKKAATGASRNVKALLLIIFNILRKIIHLLLVILGTIIGSQFLILQQLPLIPRLIGLFALITSYIGLRREYFPDKFFIRQLFSNFGVFKKNGRSSGRDGFGPGGQH
jgi:hypothetical protein